MRPRIIQGGMGVAVSGWRLANTVSRLGQLGVVSGTALDVVHARRLGDGDPGGHLRRAYAAFPQPRIADDVLRRWFVPGGRDPARAYRTVPRFELAPPTDLLELTVLANFAEVWLAKEGHGGSVGINYLEKVQLPTPAAVYGAVLAGVDVVLVGAGIPAAFPQLLTDLAAGTPVAYRVDVAGDDQDARAATHFDPASVLGELPPVLPRPRFFAIVSSNVLATFLARDPATSPDGFVIETHRAGGHNAPPRGRGPLDERGQPVYGPKDEVDLAKLAALGLPFWLAGGYARPDALRDALAAGAEGVQIGTAFALCEESSIDPSLKQAVIDRARSGSLRITTDPLASPSGYPFKIAELAGTVADPEVVASRRRVCDLGFLRSPYRRPDGSIGYRCPSEPVADYVRKGGRETDTVGRKCLCNGLLATVGLGQFRAGGAEPALVTMGDDVTDIVRTLARDDGHWTAADVIGHLLEGSGA